MASWRDVLSIHPAAEFFPLMSPNELRELAEDIKKHGLRSPVMFCLADDGKGRLLLDGRNRLDAMELIGRKLVNQRDELALDVRYQHGLANDDDPYAYVISANIHRRHLTAEQRRELIAKLIKATPEKSDRQIAETVKASPTTVGTVRASMEARGEVSKLDTRIDRKGVKQPAKKEPKPEPKPRVNPACAPLFENKDQFEAFEAAVTTKAARRFISWEQQLDLAKAITESYRKHPRRGRVPFIKAYVSGFVRDASRAQGKIDAEETDDFYKQFPGHEIRDEVAAAKSAARSLDASLLKLETLVKKFPGHPFFGDIGSTLDTVINMIRQYRRAANEKSSDETERKLTRLQELEHKTRLQESTITGLRSEIEELKARLATTPPADDGLDIPPSLRRDAP
jgi:ParB/Sulfiredoxin domain